MHHEEGPVKGVIILLPGGTGMNLLPNGTTRSGNFLIRTRELFYNAGFDVVAVSNASDQKVMAPSYRASAEHVADLEAVVRYVKAHSDAPVWLVGTSRGTTSTAAAAVVFGNQLLAGVVLTSSVTTGQAGGSVLDQKLDQIKIPVLVVAHDNDTCKVTPPNAANTILRNLTNAPVTKLIVETGGISSGDPCEAFAHHGYNGIEAQTVSDITNWMAAPSQ